MSNPTESVLGYDVYRGSPDACVAEILASLDGSRPVRSLACLNPHSYAVALNTPLFACALRNSDWLIPDGVGVVLAARVLRGGVQTRVTGSDIFRGVNAGLNDRGGGSVFFLGSTHSTLDCIRNKMAQDYPRVRVVGTYSPPFTPEYSASEIDGMVTAINAVRPDVVWVGLTAPKQEMWIHRVRARLDAGFVAGIGAVFDFYSGRITRSPAAFQRLGLEWLPRLAQEPRRLWRRMFISAPIFIAHVVHDRVRGARRSTNTSLR